MEQASVIELIRKCFSLSKSPNEEEAARALEKAHELLAKYNLEMLDIEKSGCMAKPVVCDIRIPVGSRDWKKILVHGLAKHNFCYALTSGSDMIIIGRPQNIVCVMEIAGWIILQLEDRAQIATMMHDTNKMAFRNAFLVGAVRRINDRLAEMRKREEVMSTALTILDTEAKEFAYKKFNVGRGRAMGQANNSEGYSAGREFGGKVSLTPPSQQVH
jgi:hypothetical protein